MTRYYRPDATNVLDHWPPTLSDLADAFALVEAQNTRVETIRMSKGDLNAINFEAQMHQHENLVQSLWGAEVYTDKIRTGFGRGMRNVPQEDGSILLIGERAEVTGARYRVRISRRG
jgi:hypothetical protein